jgi:hypothetical protein
VGEKARGLMAELEGARALALIDGRDRNYSRS